MFKNIHVPSFRSASQSATGQKEQDEQSLTTTLRSHEDRTALLLLIAKCTDTISQSIRDNFDPKVTGSTEDNTIISTAAQDLGTSFIDLTARPDDQDHEPPQDITGADDAKVQARKEAEEHRRQDYERRVKELASPGMLALQEAATTHFDTWRQRVLERVGEVVNARDEEPSVTAHETPDPNHASDQDAKAALPEADEEVNEALHQLYPPQTTPLTRLDRPKRVLILHSVLLLLLSLEAYTSDSRILLLHLTSSLGLPLEVLTKDEEQIATGLLEAAKQHMSADDETKQKVEANKNSRKWKVGLGAVAGAALIGVTGGLAAPLLAAGVGSMMGGLGLGATAAAGYLGALAGSAPLVGALFGAYGGRMTGQMVDSYAREVEDFGFLPAQKDAHTSKESVRRLRVAIGISGWLTREADITTPWHVLSPAATETFALRWELQALLSLGNAITTYIKSAAWGFAKTQIIKHTIFAALTAAMWPLAILKAARMVDNPFSVARSRSEKAGRVLADALINKVQGERPVTLFGYSMGARVIYSCLTELADRKAFGLVESAVLVGAPVPADSVAWRKMRAVVSGRLVNVYSTQDYLLAFLYRSTSIQLGVAGLQAVEGVGGVQNVDVSEIVDGHTQYRFLTGKVLKKVGFEDIDEVEVDQQMAQFKKQKKEEETERQQNQTEAEAKGLDMEKDEGVEADTHKMQAKISQKDKETVGPVKSLTTRIESAQIDKKGSQVDR